MAADHGGRQPVSVRSRSDGTRVDDAATRDPPTAAAGEQAPLLPPDAAPRSPTAASRAPADAPHAPDAAPNERADPPTAICKELVKRDLRHTHTHTSAPNHLLPEREKRDNRENFCFQDTRCTTSFVSTFITCSITPIVNGFTRTLDPHFSPARFSLSSFSLARTHSSAEHVFPKRFPWDHGKFSRRAARTFEPAGPRALSYAHFCFIFISPPCASGLRSFYFIILTGHLYVIWLAPTTKTTTATAARLIRRATSFRLFTT